MLLKICQHANYLLLPWCQLFLLGSLKFMGCFVHSSPTK
ncbi:hypothetical protein BN132_4170 [Cronobacter turicensis 564]|nr:hypothetical protein BN132_4170 [Cronobacter turicensis 564]